MRGNEAPAATGGRAAPPPLTLNAWLRWDIIARELRRVDSADVLELGPGEGAAACRLAIGRRYTGVELSQRARSIAERRLQAQGTPGRLVSSLEEIPADELFGLVCAFEVIEHIEQDEVALKEWAQRLRPGGTLILSTPAGPERLAAADILVGHYRRYTADQMAAMAAAAGLVDIRTVHNGFPLGYPLEAARNAAARRVMAKGFDPEGPRGHERVAATEMSGSRFQPPAWAGRATRAASAPGRWLQRLNTRQGTGLLLFARAPR